VRPQKYPPHSENTPKQTHGPLFAVHVDPTFSPDWGGGWEGDSGPKGPRECGKAEGEMVLKQPVSRCRGMGLRNHHFGILQARIAGRGLRSLRRGLSASCPVGVRPAGGRLNFGKGWRRNYSRVGKENLTRRRKISRRHTGISILG